MNSLAVRLIKNSVVYPTIRVASHPGKLLMGVYDEDDHYVEDTALNRRFGEQGAPVPQELFPDITDSDSPEAIYAGTLYVHFGHFLLESLARAWYAQQHPDLPFVWAGQHTWQKMKLKAWQSEILELLGISNPTRIVADPARFDVLHVPDIGYRYDDWFHPEHARFLGRYEGPAQVPGHRLWLSRSQAQSEARDLNSGPTERRLEQAGWTIAHPETLSVREQLDHLSRAELVAGEEGSAFHTLILLKDVAAKKFHILRRYGAEHGNLRTIGDARQVDQTFHSLDRERVIKAEGRVVTKVSPNSSEVLDLLAVPVAMNGEAATDADTILDRALDAVAPERFLDVGATSSDLIVGSSAPVRVAVSPRFGFDPRRYADSGIDFYELGLEQYADLFHSGREPFDAIRITGSTFVGIMASFGVSKRLAHEGTIWILGIGRLAARAALAIRMTHPGFTAGRLFLQRKFVFVAQRLPGEPEDDAGVGKLSAKELRTRVRRMPLLSLRRLRGQRAETDPS